MVSIRRLSLKLSESNASASGHYKQIPQDVIIHYRRLSLSGSTTKELRRSWLVLLSVGDVLRTHLSAVHAKRTVNRLVLPAFGAPHVSDVCT